MPFMVPAKPPAQRAGMVILGLTEENAAVRPARHLQHGIVLHCVPHQEAQLTFVLSA